MSAFWAIVFLAAAGAWIGALAFGMIALRLLPHDATVLAPLTDILGTWLGAIGVLALALGREGFGGLWAGALLACALGITAGLYDRAVLMPSLDAAEERRRADPREPKWDAEWRFLWRLAQGSRVLTLACALAAIACVALIPW